MNTFRSVHVSSSWVIYQSVSKGVASGAHGVCEQAEWDEMELRWPGRQCIIQAGIASEGVAERLARGTSGDKPPRTFGAKVKPQPVVA